MSAAAGFVAFVIGGCNERSATIAPDLQIDFTCGSSPPAESAIVDFLHRQGFTAFDEEVARRRREAGFFPLQIDGYNSRQWMLDFIGLQEPPSRGRGINYRLTIMSPPPTVHHDALERAALEFVRESLHCRIQSASTYDNGLESSAMFARVFAEEQRRIAEWRSCRASGGRLDSACPR
jgi:hypothetical protein